MPVEARRISEAALEENVITYFAAKSVKITALALKPMKMTHRASETGGKFTKSGTVDYFQLPERKRKRERRKKGDISSAHISCWLKGDTAR